VCFLHIGDGLSTVTFWEDYNAAQKIWFPRGYGWQYKECDANEALYPIIDVCKECRAAEDLWNRSALQRSGLESPHRLTTPSNGMRIAVLSCAILVRIRR
jgi:hypothetical protein